MGRAEHNLNAAGEERDARSTLKIVAPPASPDSGVRAICPFCGASNPTPEYFCCADWFAMMYPASDAEEATLRRPGWMVMPSLEAIRARLAGGSQLLVTLLASAIVAVLASMATWRIASERVAEVPIQQIHTAQPAMEPVTPDTTRQVASSAPPESAPVVAPEVAAPPAAADTAASAPQPPSPPSAESESVPASSVQPPPQPAVVAAAAPAPEVVVPALPVPAAAPAPAKHVRPAPARRVVAAVASAPASTRVEPQQAAELEPKIAVAVPVQPESEVVARAAQEASAVWREPGQIARFAVPTDSSHWHSLHRGMSREGVRRLLGEPKWKRHLVGTEVWLYEENSLYSDGWVAFADPGEELTGWRGASSSH